MKNTIGPLILAAVVATILIASELKALATRRTQVVKERIVRFAVYKRLMEVRNNL